MKKIKRELGPFIRIFRPHWLYMTLGSLCGMMTLSAGVGLLSLSGWFLSATAVAGLSLPAAQLFNFFFPSIGVRLFAVSRTAARYAERIVSHDATFRILESLRSWFYRHLEPLAPGCLMRYRSGDILNRIVSDIDALDNLYLRVLSPSVVALLMAVMVTAFLWFFDPLIAGLALALLFLAGFVLPIAAGRSGAGAGRELSRHSAGLRIRIIEGLQGLSELMVFGADRKYLQDLRREDRQLIQNQRRMSHISGLSSGWVTLLSGLGVVGVLYRGVALVHQGQMSGVNLALVALAVLASFEAVLLLPSAYQYLGRTREAGRRLLEIADAQPAVRFPGQSGMRLERWDLTFENVAFRYADPAPMVLDGVDFEVAQGQRVAILGETGSGKTTLANLLVRFWNPSRGRILLGGLDIRDLSEPDLRRCISVVSQQAHMFNASIRDNLLLARPAASDAQLLKALAEVSLRSFVEALPDGLDTWLGESGKRLSGGQARRLAVARALLHDAPVWVLDEPSEGLDRPTEQQMMQSIYRISAGRTVLLISHRLVDLNLMDRIVILENGRVAAQGSHAMLLESSPRYAKWYSLSLARVI